ncbi:MAG: aminodeoxychorismate synthase component I [Deltaproteobacteria bacterium]|nr:aminodeoxychorismate synthase component I [Deltaproteobacteria bacterium]
MQSLNIGDLKNIARNLKPNERLWGYFSYEWGAALEGIKPASSQDELSLPPNWFQLETQKTGFCSLGSAKFGEDGGRKPAFKTSLSKKKYIESVEKILAYLRAGDCYQVNLTQRFTTETNEDPQTIYQRLCQISPAPYACYLDCGGFQILSASPELFLKADADGTLTTKPIKGTRPRGRSPTEDQKFKEELTRSEKDRAELLMITDLLRNDMGKIAIPGSVQVPKLREVETFSNVHHLVSTVTAQRTPDKDIIDVLTAMLPGGSITGAPKIRAMEIIRELEPVNRGVYTGAVGWIGPNNTACFNVAIRTMVIQNKIAYFNAGGGIVIDSDPQAEYEECLVKASGMMKALMPV